jgi:hypothetical protein
MNELERLIEIVRVLPPSKVHELLTVAEQMTDHISDQEFLRTINSAPPLDVDEETAVELRLALAERSETIGHEELKRKLGLA